jgi:extracellular elastinolytic metalloproteinase
VVDYYERASYNAIKLPKMVPTEGFTLLKDPSDWFASPNGWNSDGRTEYWNTQGNNVLVTSFLEDDKNTGDYKVWSPFGGFNQIFRSNWVGPSFFDSFNYRPGAKFAPDSPGNTQASAVQLFYIANFLHDIFYNYGFNEEAGNFQSNNHNIGGAEGDHILATTLNPHKANTAEFGSPPDV